MCEVSKSSVELHTLDISKPELEASALASLAESCKTWGFFQIINHGVSSDMYTKIQSMSKDVFTLPLHTKLSLGHKTYTPQFIASPFFESLKVSGPDFSSSAHTSAHILFDHQHHSDLSLFSDTLHEYGTKMAELSKRITQILLMCLGEGFDRKYESEFKDCHGYLRINNYSPPHDHHDHDDNDNGETMMEGLGMHTDMSCVTIVYQDLLGGLQVRGSQNEWVEIKAREGTLVVNVGDLFQAWSNDRLRSSEHRVVLSDHHHRHRFSLAFFWGFADEKVVLSPDEVVGENGVRLYEPFVCSDYLRFRENDQRGHFHKVAFTVKHFASSTPPLLHKPLD